MTRRRRLAMKVLAAAVLLAAGTARADNWPGWRGPNRNGVSSETDVPLTWSATEGVLWKAPLVGSGISNPVIWNERVLLTACDGRDRANLHLVCLDRDTGRERWHQRLWGTSPTRHHGTKSSMASPTPVTDGRHVFAFFGTGDVFCFDLDGRLVWHRSLAAEYGKFENRFAASSSPLLFGNLLLLQCDHYGDSYVIALEKSSGANRWKTDRERRWLSWASPQLVRLPGGRGSELVLCGSRQVEAYDPLNGRRLWWTGPMQHECIPTPLVAQGRVYVTSGPGGPSMAIRPGGRGDVTGTHVVWSNPRGAPFVPSAILVGNRYYLVTDKGIGTCLDARTGETVWQKRFPGEYTASPVAAGDRVYFTNEAGLTTVIRGGNDRYEQLARNAIGQPVYASAAISQGRLFLRTNRHVIAISDK